jgi:dihydrofolate reductase
MGKTVLDMSISLDGFVAGPNETPENGLGDNGERLHEWIFAGESTGEGGVPGRPGGVDGEMIDEMTSTGAVIAGRGTVDPANWWHGEHHDGVPIFILSRTRTPESVEQWPLLTVLGDVAEAFDRAR